MTADDVIERLSHLTTINRDAEAGLVAAARDIKNSELETLFADYAKQHAKFAEELAGEIARLGGRVSEPGSVEGAVQRGWMGVKAALSGNSTAGILASCEGFEESAAVAYDNAAEESFTGQPQALVQKQRQQVRGFHTRLVRLRDEVKDGVEFQKNE